LDEFNEINDFNIARHLLSVHRYGEAPVATEFSTEQIQRYLKYCRTIKPKLDAEAAELLVDRYRQLRANDATGVGTSYRMTVRQLESLIRLSEALARLHCDTTVRSVYVDEACRLLKASIIRVEMDNVDLEVAATEWDEAVRKVDEAAPREGPIKENASSTTIKMKYEEYMRITNMLVYQLRRMEDTIDPSQQDGGQAAGDEEGSSLGGMRKSQLVEWYLEQIEAELHSEADYYSKRSMITSMIDRLITKDSIMIAIRASSDGIDDGDPILVVHPNYSN
jgi:DNA replication licensing factor MCM6